MSMRHDFRQGLSSALGQVIDRERSGSRLGRRGMIRAEAALDVGPFVKLGQRRNPGVGPVAYGASR